MVALAKSGVSMTNTPVLFISLLNLHNGEVLARNETTGICFRSFDYGCTWIPEKPEV